VCSLRTSATANELELSQIGKKLGIKNLLPSGGTKSISEGPHILVTFNPFLDIHHRRTFNSSAINYAEVSSSSAIA
jgi:hypothetical protein